MTSAVDVLMNLQVDVDDVRSLPCSVSSERRDTNTLILFDTVSPEMYENCWEKMFVPKQWSQPEVNCQPGLIHVEVIQVILLEYV